MNLENVEEVNNDDSMEFINDFDLDEDEMIDIGMSFEMQVLNHARQQLERRQHIVAVVMLCCVVHALHLLQVLSTSLNWGVSDAYPQRESRRRELMGYLVQTEKCRDIIRMGPQAFLHLCQKLRGTGIVKDNIKSTVEEKVAKFLHIVGHNVKNRTVSFFFHRSGETVSRHFHTVLHAILALGEEFLVQPSGTNVPPQILHSSRFYPFFKDCIGAIDGTHYVYYTNFGCHIWKVKPHANRWRTMQIKHYDIKKELFGSDRATGKQSSTTRMRNQQMHKEKDPVEKDPVELNESSYVNTDLQEQNVGNFEEGIFSPPDIDSFCPNNGQSHQSTGTSGSRGTKRKASIADLVESQVERMTTGIGLLADALNNGNNISDQLHEVAKHQVVIAERQVGAIEKRNEIYQNQLTIFQHSRPRVYTEADVWDMLTEINVMEQYRMQCYEFLCSNEQKKRQIFGVPNHMLLVALSQMMNASKHK